MGDRPATARGDCGGVAYAEALSFPLAFLEVTAFSVTSAPAVPSSGLAYLQQPQDHTVSNMECANQHPADALSSSKAIANLTCRGKAMTIGQFSLTTVQ